MKKPPLGENESPMMARWVMFGTGIDMADWFCPHCRWSGNLMLGEDFCACVNWMKEVSAEAHTTR